MNKTVLIVDDDADIRSVLSEFLEFEEYAVATAANGSEALAFLRAQPHTGVVLLDLMMPVMDGFQFREAQKRDPSIASIPVVVMTASGSLGPESIDALDVLAKPLELDRLLDSLESARQP